MENKTTEELNAEIKDATDIEDYLVKNKENMITVSLHEYLEILIARKEIKKSDVARGSLLDRTYVYKIFSGKKIPSRDKLLAISYAMKLSVDETQKMLKLSGNRELYMRDKRDAIIWFNLQQNKSIFEVNEQLYTHELAVLNTGKE